MKKGVKENILVTTITGATLLFGAFLTLPRVSAEPNTEAIDRITITVPSSCSLSTSVDNPTHTATVHNREYVEDIGETTIKATCNDLNGFSVYAIGFTDETEGKTVLSASTVDHTNDIATGTATSGTTSNWAMRLSSVAGTYAPTILNGFDDYSEVPSTYTKVATLTSRTDQSLGSSFETNYAVYVSGSQLADTYTGKVKYTIVHPHSEEPSDPMAIERETASGQICYFANASGYEGSMGCQSVASSVTLLASNFSRAGYGFAGWSDKFDYATNANAKFYGPQETIAIPDTSIYTGDGKGLSLYAVWVKSQGNLQDSTKVASVCSGLTTAPTNGTANLSSVSALTDQRDNQTYAIAKLADGKCWMIENLRLEAEDTIGGTNKALAQGYGTYSGTGTDYGNFTGLANAENSNFTSTNPPLANNLYSTDGTTTNTIKNGNSSYYYARMPRYNNTNTSTRAKYTSNQNVTSQDANIYSYGNYYTWSAAMASIKQYTGPTSTDDEGKTSETANTSLCPTGWKLPRGGNKSREVTNDFWSLVVTGINNETNPANYGSSTQYYTGTPEGTDASNKLRAYPNNFLYSGSFNSSSANVRGGGGRYWSSTASGNNNSYYLFLNSFNVYPGTGSNNKYDGSSIRCVSSS